LSNVIDTRFNHDVFHHGPVGFGIGVDEVTVTTTDCVAVPLPVHVNM
jgi:hypothetical protein